MDIMIAVLVCVFSMATRVSGQFEVQTIASWNSPPNDVMYACDTDRTGASPLFFCSDHHKHVIRVYDSTASSPDAGLTVLAGNSSGTPGYQDGSLTSALFHQPQSLCLSPCDGNLYIIDYGNYVIRAIDFMARQVITVAGMPNQRGEKDGPGRQATFSDPWSIICMDDGSIIVSERGARSLRKITAPKQCKSPVDPPTPTPTPAPSPSPPSHHSEWSWNNPVVAALGSITATLLLAMWGGQVYVRRRIDAYRQLHSGRPWVRPAEVQEDFDEEEAGNAQYLCLHSPSPRSLSSRSHTPAPSPPPPPRHCLLSDPMQQDSLPHHHNRSVFQSTTFSPSPGPSPSPSPAPAPSPSPAYFPRKAQPLPTTPLLAGGCDGLAPQPPATSTNGEGIFQGGATSNPGHYNPGHYNKEAAQGPKGEQVSPAVNRYQVVTVGTGLTSVHPPQANSQEPVVPSDIRQEGDQGGLREGHLFKEGGATNGRASLGAGNVVRQAEVGGSVTDPFQNLNPFGVTGAD